MRNRVRVVTGYVPLEVKHMNPAKFQELGWDLHGAVEYAGVEIQTFNDFPYKKCWLAKEDPPMVGANPRATDRFDTDEQHAKNNVVCNQFIEWAWKSYKEYPEVDVIVALTFTVLKQGDFTGRKVAPHHISSFLERMKTYNFIDIPFPGITDNRGMIDPRGNNWRFCGSTHIWPVEWLGMIRHEYKHQVRKFIKEHKRTPLDLAIWPAVEVSSGLPFRWYRAEYDATQFTNFPVVREGPQ